MWVPSSRFRVQEEKLKEAVIICIKHKIEALPGVHIRGLRTSHIYRLPQNQVSIFERRFKFERHKIKLEKP